MAEKDYGKEKMDQYRRSADLMREPSLVFTLSRRSTYAEFGIGVQEMGPSFC